MDANLQAQGGAAGRRDGHPGQHPRRPQRPDAHPDEVRPGTHARHRDGRPPRPQDRPRRCPTASRRMPAARPLPPTAATATPRRPSSGDLGELTARHPRDRNGTFEPQLIAKHQRRLPGFDEKILALYAKGMTTRDIQEIVKELYGVEVSPTLISEITADLDAEVTAWRRGGSKPVWPIVYFDGIVVHVRGDERPRVAAHDVRGFRRESCRATRSCWACGSSETEGPSSGWPA